MISIYIVIIAVLGVAATSVINTGELDKRFVGNWEMQHITGMGLTTYIEEGSLIWSFNSDHTFDMTFDNGFGEADVISDNRWLADQEEITIGLVHDYDISENPLLFDEKMYWKYEFSNNDNTLILRSNNVGVKATLKFKKIA